MKITKEFTFDAAHMLTNYIGGCGNLHGHTYKLQITVQGAVKKGMVVDFSDLSRLVRAYIISKFDHATLLNLNGETEKELYKFLYAKDLKVCVFEVPTSVENICKTVYQLLYGEVSNMGLKIVSIKLWETPTAFAEYEGGE